MQAHTWFGPLIAWGEVLVGLGILVGGITAIAAFGGILMNFAFLYGGSASSNPTLLLFGILLIWGWQVAGWIGLDRWIMPMLARVRNNVQPGSPGAGLKPGGAAVR